ncbi:MAG: GNAT family N-acetyltransferase [Candidatus Heimdallarchaeota archaeon]
MISDNIVIRQATIADLSDLVRLRRMMFEAMGFDDPAQLHAADLAAADYFAEAIPDGKFFGWLAIMSNGEAAASGGVTIDHHPPGPTNLSGQIGYIMNLVTIPQYRRQGIARRIMQTMLRWLADRGVTTLALHATEVGRPMYEELGFVDSNEMRLRLQ